MEVHIIRDQDVSQELYQEVVELLQAHAGPLNFRTNEDFSDPADMEGGAEDSTESPSQEVAYSFVKILNQCEIFRKRNDIGDDEMVILLTTKANKLNWFSYGDTSNNVFIHTSDWDFFLDCNRSFPIAYEVASNILQSLLFNDMDDLDKHIHKDESRGCVNDFCRIKKDIRLKMKTADICTDCQKLIIERDFPYNIFLQITEIFEELRKKLISVERFTSLLGPGRVLFKGYLRKMFLLDVGNYEVKLTPLEKTVYHLFLENPEGIRAVDIADHKIEITKLYKRFYNGSNIAQFNNSINDLCNYNHQSMMEKISKINKKLDNTLKARAEQYKILRDPEDWKYKIAIDRKLISYKE